MKKYVAYYRVSTKDQYLGLDAQKAAVKSYLISKNIKLLDSELDSNVIDSGSYYGTPDFEFEEKESGKNCNRVELDKAIKLVLKLDIELKREFGLDSGCSLIIAKLDRLSRNVLFIAKLMESKVDFICCDMPHANKFMIHIMAAFAEDELNRISTRTKESLRALAANKRITNPDFKLGNPYKGGEIRANGEIAKLAFGKSRVASVSALKEKYNTEENQRAKIIAIDLRKQGLKYSEIAEHLNKYNMKTYYGGLFCKGTVHKLIVGETGIQSQYVGKFIYENTK
jgi:DNA invertase Pin-like site-specific DNA recombinase